MIKCLLLALIVNINTKWREQAVFSKGTFLHRDFIYLKYYFAVLILSSVYLVFFIIYLLMNCGFCCQHFYRKGFLLHIIRSQTHEVSFYTRKILWDVAFTLYFILSNSFTLLCDGNFMWGSPWLYFTQSCGLNVNSDIWKWMESHF